MLPKLIKNKRLRRFLANIPEETKSKVQKHMLELVSQHDDRNHMLELRWRGIRTYPLTEFQSFAVNKLFDECVKLEVLFADLLDRFENFSFKYHDLDGDLILSIVEREFYTNIAICQSETISLSYLSEINGERTVSFYDETCNFKLLLLKFLMF